MLRRSPLKRTKPMRRSSPRRVSRAMCSRLHAQWEQHAGAFYAWTKGQRRAWMEERIIEANARFELETGLSLTAARH